MVQSQVAPSSYDNNRQGSSLTLIAIMLSVFAIMAAITIDFAYMGLVQTELRIATDAAAKAGVEALSRTENVDNARQAAVNYAAANKVGGQSFQLSTSDVTIGKLVKNQAGDWGFVASLDKPNAVRIDAKTGGDAVHSAVSLFFGSVLGTSSFTPSYSATAGQQDVAVCLSIDRSGSMLFDMSGTDFSYPPNNPLLSSFAAWGLMWRNHLSPPNPVGSRWAVLTQAVDVFLEEAGNFNPPPRVGLVTWAADYQMPIAPFTQYQKSKKDKKVPKHLENHWNTNKAEIKASLTALGTVPMMGGTNLSAGLDDAVASLLDPEVGSFSSKVVILMTDGQWNDGRNPIDAAHDARDAGIVVHTVSMMTGYHPDMAAIAEITGGKYYRTTNAQQLSDAFRELARSLPIVLVE
jgi:Flp pilus assembly protein TadG